MPSRVSQCWTNIYRTTQMKEARIVQLRLKLHYLDVWMIPEGGIHSADTFRGYFAFLFWELAGLSCCIYRLESLFWWLETRLKPTNLKKSEGHYVTESRFGSRLWCQHINIIWHLMKKCLQKIKEHSSECRSSTCSFPHICVGKAPVCGVSAALF